MLASLVTTTLLCPVLMAQRPSYAAVPVHVQPSAKHFSSNAVRATFRGFKNQDSSPTLSDMLSPETNKAGERRIAIFEVLEPLAYKRLSPYASQQMTVGQLFKVELDVPIFGQSADITAMVKTLVVGEEVVAKVDEVFVFDGMHEGQMQTTLVRMVRRNATGGSPAPAATAAPVVQATPAAVVPAATPAGSDEPAEIQAQDLDLPTVGLTSASEQRQDQRQARFQNINHTDISVRVRNGVQEVIRIEKSMVPGAGREYVRMYINDVEVDPDTQEPLAASSDIPANFEKIDEPVQPQPAAPAPSQEAAPLPSGSSF